MLKKLFLPVMFDEETSAATRTGFNIIPGMDAMQSFYEEGKAQEHAKNLAMANPKGKVVIFAAVSVIEPREIKFAEKKYNEQGELIV